MPFVTSGETQTQLNQLHWVHSVRLQIACYQPLQVRQPFRLLLTVLASLDHSPSSLQAPSQALRHNSISYKQDLKLS